MNVNQFFNKGQQDNAQTCEEKNINSENILHWVKEKFAFINPKKEVEIQTNIQKYSAKKEINAPKERGFKILF